jgi:hypothetical protein
MQQKKNEFLYLLFIKIKRNTKLNKWTKTREFSDLFQIHHQTNHLLFINTFPFILNTTNTTYEYIIDIITSN